MSAWCASTASARRRCLVPSGDTYVHVQFLRDATAAMLDATHAQTTLPLDVLKRARHGITAPVRMLPDCVDPMAYWIKPARDR